MVTQPIGDSIPSRRLRRATAVHLLDPEAVGPQPLFQEIPEGKVVNNRIHLELHVGGCREVPLHTRRRRVDPEAARLVGAGATRLRVPDQQATGRYLVVMQDPEGNEFCLP